MIQFDRVYRIIQIHPTNQNEVEHLAEIGPEKSGNDIWKKLFSIYSPVIHDIPI